MGSLLPSNTYAGKDIDLWQPAGDNQTITGNLIVVGTTECDAAVTCNNTLNVTNEITAGSITVPAGVITGAIVSATDGFACTGSATITGSVIAGLLTCIGDASITGNITGGLTMSNGNMELITTTPDDATNANLIVGANITATNPNGLTIGNITGTRIFGLNGTNSDVQRAFADTENIMSWFGTDNLLVYISLPGDAAAPSLNILMPQDILTNQYPYIGKKICTYLVQPYNSASGISITISYPNEVTRTYTLPPVSTGLSIDVYFVGFEFFSPDDTSAVVVNWSPSNVVLPEDPYPPTPP
jgi:hypothetical protein